MELVLYKLVYIDDVSPYLWLTLHGATALLVVIVSYYLFRLKEYNLVALGVFSLLNPLTEFCQFVEFGSLLDYTADLSFVSFWSIFFVTLYWATVFSFKPHAFGLNGRRYVRGAGIFVFVFALLYELLQANYGVGTVEDVAMYTIALFINIGFTAQKEHARADRRSTVKLQGEGGVA